MSWPLVATGAEPTADFFEKRVRPVLAEHCLQCHGSKKQMSGLRLDTRAGLLQGGDNGPAVVPGDPARSSLIKAVRHIGDRKMPPRKKLNAEAVEALTAWVKMGVPWPQTRPAGPAPAAWKNHWAFQPIADPPLPAVKNSSWPQTSVDRFILAKLEAKGLKPSAPADRRTLLRRVTFDLVGLPPTPEETAAFEADPSPDAFAKVVDRLLASPHYGERWGRYWLDVARYADTKGYVFFEDGNFPWSYTYRDYVVRAFNRDLPYDQFIREQLAADLLPGADRRALPALGFLSLGGRFMNNVQDILDDRIDVVTRGLLGLTVTCARCHDHKFDPIPTRDYYSLYGVFASCVEPAVPPLFEDPPQTKEYEAFVKELHAREKKLADFVEKKHADVVAAAKTRAAEYLLAAQALLGRPTTEEFMLIADGNDLNPTMVARWKAYLDRTRKTHHPVWAPWHTFAALPEKEFAGKGRDLAGRIGSTAGAGNLINPVVAMAIADRPPQSLADLAKLYAELLNAADKAANPNPAQGELRQVFHGPGSPPNWPLSATNDLALFPDRASQGRLQELRKAVEKWRIEGRGAPPRAMTLQDLPNPHQPRVFLRGNPNNLGEAVPRQFLGVLCGEDRKPFEQGSGRLELARAIADPANPLTARVMVNRIWLHHFGAALVRTPSDFGLRSEPPTHPELLDHLARVFRQGGWSAKKMHRLIVLSAVYQQQAGDRGECRRVDPDNALLWKMNRRRLDFEATRDALLAVSGHLDRKLGGPPVRDLLGPQTSRRTVYGFIDRLNLPTLLRTFDYPSPDATSPQRDATTVPPQALFLMNNPFVLESARRLIRRPEIAGEPDVARRVGHIYRVLYGRSPSAEEVALAQEYLAGAPSAAKAWQRYAQALLLANEFVFVD